VANPVTTVPAVIAVALPGAADTVVPMATWALLGGEPPGAVNVRRPVPVGAPLLPVPGVIDAVKDVPRVPVNSAEPVLDPLLTEVTCNVVAGEPSMKPRKLVAATGVAGAHLPAFIAVELRFAAVPDPNEMA
jgi:hypothetical protein